MSVSKDPRSPYWRFDFQHRGHRFFGSTKATTRREAEAVEKQERARAKVQVAQTEAAKTSLRLDDVAGRYWIEVGQHVKGARDIHRVLGYLVEHFGKDKLLTEIDGNDVARLVAWRRGHKKRCPALPVHSQRHHGDAEDVVYPRRSVGHALRSQT